MVFGGVYGLMSILMNILRRGEMNLAGNVFLVLHIFNARNMLVVEQHVHFRSCILSGLYISFACIVTEAYHAVLISHSGTCPMKNLYRPYTVLSAHMILSTCIYTSIRLHFLPIFCFISFYLKTDITT